MPEKEFTFSDLQNNNCLHLNISRTFCGFYRLIFKERILNSYL